MITTSDIKSRQSSLRSALPVILLVLVFAALDFADDVVVFSIRRETIEVRRFDAQTISWIIWLMLVPVLVLVTEWARPDRLGWLKTTVVQFVSGIIISLAQPAIAALVIASVISRAPGPMQLYPRFLDLLFVPNVALYMACVAAYLSHDYLRRSRTRILATATAELRASQMESLVTEARLAALRRELQPHFLYNALQSVSGLIRSNSQDRALEMLTALDQLLEASYQSFDSGHVALEDELQLLTSYLSIETVRFEERMNVEVDVADDLLDLKVPPLMLQPLVENAVRHGVARSLIPVRIVIRVRAVGTRCRIIVENDGPRMSANIEEGVGLSNTRSRLHLLYGNSATLDIRSRAGGGAIVELEFPMTSLDAEEQHAAI